MKLKIDPNDFSAIVTQSSVIIMSDIMIQKIIFMRLEIFISVYAMTWIRSIAKENLGSRNIVRINLTRRDLG